MVTQTLTDYRTLEKSQLRRCKSTVDLLSRPTPMLPHRLRSSIGLYSLNRSATTSDLSASYNRDGDYVSEKYWPAGYDRRWLGSWGRRGSYRAAPIDEYYWSMRGGTSPLFWPTHNWPHQRYGYHADKAPAFWMVYPDLFYWPKYGRLAAKASLEPIGWHHTNDPSARSSRLGFMSWNVSDCDRGLSAHLYRRKVINYDAVDRNWLAPRRFRRYVDGVDKPFDYPTWQTSPMRYFHKFDNM